MKTFIFTFVLLAGYSFWETKAQAPENSVDCFWKFVKASPTFFDDFVGVACAVYSKTTPEEKAEKIKNFAKKYTDLVDGCNIFQIISLNKETVDGTAMTAAEIVDAFTTALANLGFTNELIEILCNPNECAKKVAEALTDLKKPKGLFGLFECKKGENQDNIVDKLIEKCLPKTDLGGIADAVTLFIRGKILNNEIVKNALGSIFCPKPKPKEEQS